jgi:orotate phosphoribosyltransferase
MKSEIGNQGSEVTDVKADDVLTMFSRSGALLEGHFLLTSGNHSNQYFQCAKVLQYPEYAERLCEIIAAHFRNKSIDVVIAPAIGGIVVGQEVARQLGVRSIFTERKEDAMQLRRGFEIKPGERVLVCEDVVTTGGSVIEVIDVVKNYGGILAGVGFIVDRSGGSVRFPVANPSDQIACYTTEAVKYAPDECPLCKSGSTPVKPGSR